MPTMCACILPMSAEKIALPRVILAPMAGVTDRPFRIMCRRYGATLAASEMISSQAMRYGDLKTARLAEILDDDTPLLLQIFGHDPEWMAQAARSLATGTYRGCTSTVTPYAIDINMGCPVKKIVSNGDGSALMKTPALCGAIITACADALRETGIPLTVKIRAGWDEHTINAAEIARIAEASGAAAVAVHGRTRAQMYAPSSSNAIIRDVVRAVSIPVIGNGDIYSGADAVRMFEETGCAAVMPARGTMGNPWLFDEISCALSGRPYSPPEPEERLTAALEHLQLVAVEKGEDTPIHNMRSTLGWYVKHFRNAASLRVRLNEASTAAEMREILRTAL